MLIVVMGVSGSGKTTVGRLLADRLGFDFLEGDTFHPPENIAKMRRGEPLGDEDRWPWLDRLNGELRRAAEAGRGLVLTCSALKRRYRDRLRSDAPTLRFIYLRGELNVIEARLRFRKGHFMPPDLLESQFKALEEPEPDEAALAVSVAGTPEEIATEVIARIAAPLSPAPPQVH